jgi:hypothetical protein
MLGCCVRELGAPDERSLFDVMRRQILTTPMPAARRLPRIPVVRFTGRPRVLAGGATAVFAAACAAVLAVTAATTAPPAFAVTNNQDGSVTITLNEITGVSGLNAELASMGVAIRAVPVVSGCNAPVRVVGPDGGLQPARTLAVSRLPTNPRTGSPSTLRAITVDAPHTPGQTEILAASTTGIDLLGQTVQGQVPSCVAPAGSTPSAAGTRAVGGGKTTVQLGSR